MPARRQDRRSRRTRTPHLRPSLMPLEKIASTCTKELRTRKKRLSGDFGWEGNNLFQPGGVACEHNNSIKAQGTTTTGGQAVGHSIA